MIASIKSTGTDPNSLSNLEAKLASPQHYRFTQRFSGNEFFFEDHIIGGISLIPGVCYIELASAAYAKVFHGERRVVIHAMTWFKPILNIINTIDVDLKFDNYYWHLSITSGQAENVLIHNTAKLTSDNSMSDENFLVFENLLARKTNAYSKIEFYQKLTENNALIGPSLQSVEWLGVLSPTESLAYLSMDGVGNNNLFHFHPAILDGAVQSAINSFFYSPFYQGGTYYPFRCGKITILTSAPLPLACYVYINNKNLNNPNSLKSDITIFDKQGKCIIVLHDFLFVKAKAVA